MTTFIWAAIIGAIVGIIKAAPDVTRRGPTASWFDLQQYRTASKKQSGRAQQKPRTRRTR